MAKLKLPFELEKPSTNEYVTQLSEIGYGSKSAEAIINEVSDFVQGGYSSGGIFTPTNLQRISTKPIKYGLKFQLKQTYKITAICWFEEDGSFISSKGANLRDINIDRGYLVISIGHSSSHPSGENSLIDVYENPYDWAVQSISYKDEQDINARVDNANQHIDVVNQDKSLLQLFQGGLNSSTGEKSVNDKRLYSSFLSGDGIVSLNTGYIVLMALFYEHNGTFINKVDVNSSTYRFSTTKLMRFVVKKGENLVVLPTEDVVNEYAVISNIKNIVRVSKFDNGSYNTISEAVSHAGDNTTTPVVILIYPGVYEESIGALGHPNLSFIGVDKETCIIKSTSGLYGEDPLKYQGVGLISNLTFISTHDDYNYDEETVGNIKNYALHIDNQSLSARMAGTLIVDNCNLYCEQGSAIGAGMREDFTLIIENCKVDVVVPNWNVRKEYGGIYVHSFDGLVSGQNLMLTNNVVHTNTYTGITVVQGGQNRNKINLRAYNNVSYSSVNGHLANVDAALDYSCIGNSANALNYQNTSLYAQGGYSSSDGSHSTTNQRISINKLKCGVRYTLNVGYKVTTICWFEEDGTFIQSLSVIPDFSISRGYIALSIGHSSAHSGGENSPITPEEEPFAELVYGEYYINNNLHQLESKALVSPYMVQGGYSVSDGSFTPTNTKRISLVKVANGIKYNLNTGYEVTAIVHFDNNGTFIERKTISNSISILSGYICLSIKHNASHPSGNDTPITPDEDVFESVFAGTDFIQSEVSEVPALNDHTKWVSQYREAWSTINCAPYFFKRANTGGCTYNLNIVLNTDFHFHLNCAEAIAQWTDQVVNKGVKCFLCLGDMDAVISAKSPAKTIAGYVANSATIWNMFVNNKYHKPQLVVLGNHDLNVEGTIDAWATKAQQKAAFITPMLQNYGNASIFVNGIVTDSNNSEACYWYADIETDVAKVRIIGTDVFDYPTPIVNTSSVVTPDSANIDYDNNWVYWYYSDYLKLHPIEGIANRRDLGYSVKQLQFIIQALSSLPEGYTAIVCGHTFENWTSNPDTTTGTYWVGDSGRALKDILVKFKGKSNGSYNLASPIAQTLTYDFSSVASNDVFMLQGHTHNFLKTVSSGIKLFVAIATDGNYNKPINRMSSREACDIIVLSNDGADNGKTIRFVRYGCVGRGTANLANDTDTTADANGFHYVDNPETIYD